MAHISLKRDMPAYNKMYSRIYLKIGPQSKSESSQQAKGWCRRRKLVFAGLAFDLRNNTCHEAI
jgi:hypothetical protein